MENADYVRGYIAQVNTALQERTLEVCSLKAQLELANSRISELTQKLKEQTDSYESSRKEENSDPSPS